MISFSYRGISSTDFPVDVWRVVRDYGPEVRNTLLRIPGKSGAYPVRQDDEERIIEIRFYLYADSATHARQLEREVANWLSTDKDVMDRPIAHPIIFSDEPDKRYMGYTDRKIFVREEALIADCELRFVCPMPYAENLTPEVVSGKSGINGGVVPTPPVITVTVTEPTGITDLKLELAASNKSLFLEGSFAQHNEIVFDKEKRLVTVNGTDARTDLHFERRWFDVPVGSWAITTTPTSGIDVQVWYRERFR